MSLIGDTVTILSDLFRKSTFNWLNVYSNNLADFDISIEATQASFFAKTHLKGFVISNSNMGAGCKSATKPTEVLATLIFSLKNSFVIRYLPVNIFLSFD